MANPETATAYELATSALATAAQEQGLPAAALSQVLDRVLAAQGLPAGQLTSGQLQGLLFPELDRAYSGVLEDEPRQRLLRTLSEQLVAQELDAVFAPAPAAETELDTAGSQTETDTEDAAESGEDWEFGEDEFEFEDPEYLAAPAARSYDLSSAADQNSLIAELGRVGGVQSVMICRQNGEVVQARSLKDLTALGSVVAATVLLLRGHALRLMSAQVGGTVVCVRPLGDYAVAVLADPEVNVGRLLGELSQLQTENAA
ncbi:roadblock/LC7 domain-containing protein [Deinococcus sp. Marseille-Q6407]|uniref:roadblock/LC7 domain-containing protein n=1 Tax=Deinococcus sp. Marseille-Q6407 TaxID=2969223 RepID=UPI0021C1CF02|nr:roadblock/LC7 domain-containing protein [Deinococcus sp. Marseille-Q6407]